MMSTGIEPVREAIMARLATYGDLVEVKGFRGQLVGEEKPPTDEWMEPLPYYVVIFGGRQRVPSRQQGIVGARGDSKVLTTGIEVYGRDSSEKDRLADAVEDALEGFEPAGEGEMRSMYSGKIENPIDLVKNHFREGIGLTFFGTVNTTLPADLFADEQQSQPATDI